MQFMTLDRNAIIIAVIMGAIMLFTGGIFGPYFLLLMVYFVVVSGAVTYIKRGRKERMGLYQGLRGPRNVIANGLMPLIFAIGAFTVYTTGHAFLLLAMVVGFASSVASVMADKFSSEIGVLDGVPIELFSFKPVKKGKSGAVTPLGISAGFLGSFVVSITVFALPAVGMAGAHAVFSGAGTGMIAAIVALAGFVGTIVDSMFGYFEERGYGNKYSSNFICSAIGGLLGVMLFVVMF